MKILSILLMVFFIVCCGEETVPTPDTSSPVADMGVTVDESTATDTAVAEDSDTPADMSVEDSSTAD